MPQTAAESRLAMTITQAIEAREASKRRTSDAPTSDEQTAIHAAIDAMLQIQRDVMPTKTAAQAYALTILGKEIYRLRRLLDIH